MQQLLNEGARYVCELENRKEKRRCFFVSLFEVKLPFHAKAYCKSEKLFLRFNFTRNLIFTVVVVSTSSASSRMIVLIIVHVFNFRGSGQPRIIPI